MCQNSGQNKYNQDFRKQTSFCNYVYLFIVLLPPNFLEILLLRMIKLMFYVYLIQICFFCDFAPECALYVSSRLFLMMLLLSKTVRDEIIIIVSIDLSRLILFRVFELCFIYKRRQYSFKTHWVEFNPKKEKCPSVFFYTKMLRE